MKLKREQGNGTSLGSREGGNITDADIVFNTQFFVDYSYVIVISVSYVV